MAGTETMVKTGILYGVGVGPGDPELMTVKAWRLISMAPVIAYLAANGKDSTARDIALPFIPDDAEHLVIDMPMRTERQAGERAYDFGAAAIAVHLKAGRDVVVLCEGDPFFYGSFMYLFSRLARDFTTVVVPGVTSITASAAAIRRPLSARNEVVKILPATLADDRLRGIVPAHFRVHRFRHAAQRDQDPPIDFHRLGVRKVDGLSVYFHLNSRLNGTHADE